MNREGLAGYFRKDTSTLCILALLKHAEELYGYELMQQLSRYTEGSIAMPEGTLYPILYRLEEQGCVVSEKRQIGKRMQRVYGGRYTVFAGIKNGVCSNGSRRGSVVCSLCGEGGGA